jgi:NAD(P) transhydrogenase subunit alpha
MKLGVPKETAPGERRVAIVPDAAAALKKAGIEVLVESGAGAGAFFSDADYEKAGARVRSGSSGPARRGGRRRQGSAAKRRRDRQLRDRRRHRLVPSTGKQRAAHSQAWRPQDQRVQHGPDPAHQPRAVDGRALVAGEHKRLQGRAHRGAVALEVLPAATTAAGTIFAAKVLVLGAGVAGLQAIATARRLGAVVWGYDVRPVVREQVESLGAKFSSSSSGEGREDKGGYARELAADDAGKQRNGSPTRRRASTSSSPPR